MTRYSEDGAGVDERVAVLEFELRKAKENINSLRANLTVVTGKTSSINYIFLSFSIITLKNVQIILIFV